MWVPLNGLFSVTEQRDKESFNNKNEQRPGQYSWMSRPHLHQW